MVATDQPGVVGVAERLPYNPGSQNEIPLSSATDADDVIERMLTQSNIATADDCNADFLRWTPSPNAFEAT